MSLSAKKPYKYDIVSFWMVKMHIFLDLMLKNSF